MLDSLMLSPGQRESLDRAAGQYAASVDLAASYLAARGVSETEAHSALLGYVAEPVPGHERFVGWVSIPYVTRAGVVAIKFRCARDHDCHASDCQRYDAPAGQKTRLYNARVCDEGGAVGAIVEGEFKAIACTYKLGIPAVGTNAGTWLDHWTRTMANFDRVLVIADNDHREDGANPGRKHAEKVVKAVPGAELVLPPLGVQLDEWIAQEGVDVVLKAVGV